VAEVLVVEMELEDTELLVDDETELDVPLAELVDELELEDPVEEAVLVELVDVPVVVDELVVTEVELVEVPDVVDVVVVVQGGRLTVSL
jgi:hypothetical protein